MTALSVDSVSLAIDDQPILDRVMLEVQPGEFVGLVGPNGSGKSSLLRTIYRVLRPQAGLISTDDDDVWAMTARDAARRTAVMAQETHAEFDFTVRELVLTGRTPHKGLFDRDTAEDSDIVAQGMAQTGVTHLADRHFATLSGGEKQRVLLARALAQRAKFLVLDEPTNHLDIRYQLELLELVRSLRTTSLAALHDLNLAARYCDRIVVMQAGKVRAAGTPAEVLTPSIIAAAFGVSARIDRDEHGTIAISFRQIVR